MGWVHLLLPLKWKWKEVAPALNGPAPESRGVHQAEEQHRKHD